MPKPYITTAIYYVNSVPHIGSAQEAVMADVIARFWRMVYGEAHFLTGTDENAIKVFEAAQANGKSPHAYVDEISAEWRQIFDSMHVCYDDFIRTTEKRHIDAVQEAFRRLQSAGYIYKGDYEGWYDVRTETFFKESELVDGMSPDGNEVRWVKEQNYFFKLSAFEKQILEHIEANPGFIQPDVRRNEVLSFIKQGLRDACITRASTGWGIPVPDDDSQVIYVWFDALINYISAIGWPDERYKDFWPAKMQLVGKDILVRFHATLWPAMLMGLGLPLPESLVGHGWTLMGDEKISKSTGNVVAPLDLAQTLVDRGACKKELAVDAVRYYMMRIMPFESDSKFSLEDFDLKYNTELVNDISNGVHRVISMTNNFVGGVIGATPEAEFANGLDAIIAKYVGCFSEYRVESAIDQVRAVAVRLNSYIDESKPWELNKAGEAQKLHVVLANMLLCVRSLELTLRPFAPVLADELSALVGQNHIQKWQDIVTEIAVPIGHKISPPKPIYQRLEKEKKVEPVVEEKQVDETITIDDFLKVKLKIARVVDAHRIEGADKLLRLELLVGQEKRQVLAGIAQQYTPEELVGKQVVLVANLSPRKMRGFESQGMILAADDVDGSAILLYPEKEAPDGTSVH